MCVFTLYILLTFSWLLTLEFLAGFVWSIFLGNIIFSLELGVNGGLITLVCSLMLSLSLPVYQVRLDWLPLPCIALIRPSQLSCLGSSVGRASASLGSSVGRASAS